MVLGMLGYGYGCKAENLTRCWCLGVKCGFACTVRAWGYF